MEHYICHGGCKSVSEKPGACEALECEKPSHPLEPCNCLDNAHHGAFEPNDEKPESPEATDDAQI